MRSKSPDALAKVRANSALQPTRTAAAILASLYFVAWRFVRLSVEPLVRTCSAS